MVGEEFELVDRGAALSAIRRMNEDDLRFLNRLIVEQLKIIGQARNTVMLARFSIGDRVSFQSSFGERMSGFIVRLNKKTASIVTDDGHPRQANQRGQGYPSRIPMFGGPVASDAKALVTWPPNHAREVRNGAD